MIVADRSTFLNWSLKTNLANPKVVSMLVRDAVICYHHVSMCTTTTPISSQQNRGGRQLHPPFFFHLICGVGKPSAEQGRTTAEPREAATFWGFAVHRGGTVTHRCTQTYIIASDSHSTEGHQEHTNTPTVLISGKFCIKSWTLFIEPVTIEFNEGWLGSRTLAYSGSSGNNAKFQCSHIGTKLQHMNYCHYGKWHYLNVCTCNIISLSNLRRYHGFVNRY